MNQKRDPASAPNPVPLTLDDRDYRILHLLQSDGSCTDVELARKVNLSPSGLKKRRLKLESSGIIQETVALLDRNSLGLGLLCFVQVSLTHHQPDAVRRLRSVVQEIPEVLECHFVTGQSDYLLKVVARNQRDLELLLTEKLGATPGVDRLSTSVVLNEIKRTTSLPLRPPE